MNSAAVLTKSCLPLLKWAGGKRLLLRQLLDVVPDTFERYYEPFIGGGALFFALRPAAATLGDTNAELINAYIVTRDQPAELLKALSRLRNTEAEYYKVRASRPRSELGRAARLMYLVRLSFNVLHRVNRSGEFNVPYGHKTHLATADPNAILSASHALAGTRLFAGDFEATVQDASRGDLVYFDPPYTVAHAQNGFLKYNERIFSWSDQERLAAVARSLARKGCVVVVSNADHPTTVRLFAGFRQVAITRHSVIAAHTAHRRKVSERLFVLGV